MRLVDLRNLGENSARDVYKITTHLFLNVKLVIIHLFQRVKHSLSYQNHVHLSVGIDVSILEMERSGQKNMPRNTLDLK